jgi:hypothetical protein
VPVEVVLVLVVAPAAPWELELLVVVEVPAPPWPEPAALEVVLPVASSPPEPTRRSPNGSVEPQAATTPAVAAQAVSIPINHRRGIVSSWPMIAARPCSRRNVRARAVRARRGSPAGGRRVEAPCAERSRLDEESPQGEGASVS